MTATTAPATPATHADAVRDLVASRWSPRSFDPEATLDDAALARLLEAARWAPSAMNVQPWRFVLAPRGSENHARLVPALSGNNQLWAPDASALILVLADTLDAQGNPWHYAAYDTGQAVALLTLQAHADGFAVHQMGGFDRGVVAESFGLPERFVPQVVVAVGTSAGPERLPEALAARETAPRVRRELAELVLTPEVAPR